MDRPSSADEGDEETKGQKYQSPEAGTTREASVALATPPLPWKRWGVKVEAVRCMWTTVFRAGMGSSARFPRGALGRDLS